MLIKLGLNFAKLSSSWDWLNYPSKLFCELNPNSKFQNPRTNPSRRKITGSEGREEKEREKFPLAPMEVLARGAAHAIPSVWPPIDTSRNFLPHMSAHSPLNISPNPSEVISKVSEH